MQPIDTDLNLELVLRAEHEERVRRSLAPEGNRQERRAEAAQARRARKRMARAEASTPFYGTASTVDIIAS